MASLSVSPQLGIVVLRLVEQRPGRRERGVILVVVVGAHAVVLILLAHPVTLSFPDRSDDEGAIEVVLRPPDRPPAVRAAAASVGPLAARAPRATPAEVAPLAEVRASPAPEAGPPSAGPSAGLRAALRGSGVGCANAEATGLNRQERQGCAERRGALARNAPVLAAPIAPDKRAYYDAVAEAYRDRGQAVPLTARGAAGMFDTMDSVHASHGPRVGCSVKFGPNARKAPKAPANALRAGPCFIQPPVGSLTPEGDIRKPY